MCTRKGKESANIVETRELNEKSLQRGLSTKKFASQDGE